MTTFVQNVKQQRTNLAQRFILPPPVHKTLVNEKDSYFVLHCVFLFEFFHFFMFVRSFSLLFVMIFPF